jgi:hypothetical protein
MQLHLDVLSAFQDNHSVVLLVDDACLAKKQQLSVLA